MKIESYEDYIDGRHPKYMNKESIIKENYSFGPESENIISIDPITSCCRHLASSSDQARSLSAGNNDRRPLNETEVRPAVR